MRLIDADHLNEKRIPNCPIEEGGIPLADFATHIKILEMYPTADAVPVVRCKNCKHHTPATDKFMGWCELARIETRPSDYCSYGERK